jgi:hypothetical protein
MICAKDVPPEEARKATGGACVASCMRSAVTLRRFSSHVVFAGWTVGVHVHVSTFPTQSLINNLSPLLHFYAKETSRGSLRETTV